jgi:hypothetical protein
VAIVVRKNRGGCVLSSVEPVDVVYRRLETLDPMDARTGGGAGAPGITWAAQSGGVVGERIRYRLVRAGARAPAAAQSLLGEPLELQALDPTTCWPPVCVGSYGGPCPVPLRCARSPDGMTVMDGGVGRGYR